MRPCFAFTAKTATKPPVLAIDDEIGFWGVQAKDFRSQLDAVEGDELVVEINSPGGDVFAGLGIYNMLRSFAASGKVVTTRITGVAASIASVIFLAGDKREMPSNAMVMIHGVASGGWGTVDEMQERVDVMKKIQASLKTVYTSRMGVDEARADELMAKDNWFSADEALAEQVATVLTDAVEVTAKFNVERADLPEHVAKLFKATQTPVETATETPPTEAPADPVVTAEQEAQLKTPEAEAIAELAASSGMGAHAKFFALHCKDLKEAKARIATAREVTALCTVAGKPEAASGHIYSGKSVDEIRAALVQALSESDFHIEASAPEKPNTTTGGTASPAVVNSDKLWDSHNKQLKKGS